MSEDSVKCVFGRIFYALCNSCTCNVVIQFALGLGLFIYALRYRGRNRKQLSEHEENDRIDQWTPESLIGSVPSNHPIFKKRIVSAMQDKRITVNGNDCLNVGVHNYLGLLNSPAIQKCAMDAVRKYGVGSCGPRGFYGTIDVHLELEERIAKFMNMEESLLYSYGFATTASAVPAYCKRGDLVYVDECVNFAIQKGLDASRSKIAYFKHNDVADLERILKEQSAIDRRNPKKAAKTRRFIIVEGIYVNTGEMCPLDKIIELRKRYKLRLILDESISFGVLGKNGRGITEHLDINSDDVDLICSSLENAVGSVGGFSVGSTFIVDHQRLSGLGYCFSASAPPLLAQAAIEALNYFENHPEIFEELQYVSRKLNERLSKLTHFTFRGHELSPIKHLYLKNHTGDREHTVSQLEVFVDKCIERKLAVANAAYLEGAETNCPKPSIRIIANRLLTDADIEFIFNTIECVSADLFNRT